MFVISRFMLLLPLVASQTVIADDLVFRLDSPADQSFQIVDAAKSADRVSAVTAGANPAQSSAKASPVAGRFLAKFTAPYCSPCHGWDAREKQQIVNAGFEVREYDMSDRALAQKYGDSSRGERQITSMPTFVICDLETGEWIGDKQVGYTSAAALIAQLKSGPETIPATPNEVSIYNGQPGSSHQNRGTLINHLLNEGIHRGRHSQQSLEALTDAQLDALHDQDHSGNVASSRNRTQHQHSRPQRRGAFFRGMFR